MTGGGGRNIMIADEQGFGESNDQRIFTFESLRRQGKLGTVL